MNAVLGRTADSREDSPSAVWRTLLQDASGRYRRAGRYALHSAAGKLRFDPVFRHIVAKGLVAPHERLLDIGCGRGLLMSLLLAAEESAASGRWPASWPPAPVSLHMTGIELMACDASDAQAALGGRADVICGDMCETPFPRADVVAILDVLHYVSASEQDRVLARVRQALRPGGRLLLRVGDAARSGGFRHSLWVDKIVLLLRGQRRTTLVGRPLAAWRERLESLGFANIETRAMSQGTPFANSLLVAFVAESTGCGEPASVEGPAHAAACASDLPHADTLAGTSPPAAALTGPWPHARARASELAHAAPLEGESPRLAGARR